MALFRLYFRTKPTAIDGTVARIEEEDARYVLDRVKTLAELLTRYDWRIWYFGDNIGFRGLISASRMLGTSRYVDFCYAQRLTAVRESLTRLGPDVERFKTGTIRKTRFSTASEDTGSD